MTTAIIPVTPGLGLDVAAYQINEDSVVKFLQRIIFNDSSGNELFTGSNPAQVNLAGGIAGEDLTNNVMGIVDKPVLSSAYNPNVSTSFGTSVAVNAKPTPGNVLSIYASNVSSGVAYLQLFNSTAAPVNGNVPLMSFLIPAGLLGDASNEPGILEIGKDFLRGNGFYMSSGISWGVSNSRGVFSAATPGNHTVNILYL